MSDHVRNRLVRSLGKYLIALLFWLGFARGLAPELIQRVIAGQVPGVPARVTVLLKGRSPESILSHWRVRSDGLACSLLAHWIISAALLKTGRDTCAGDDKARRDRLVWIASAAFMAVACLSGTRHDYWSYAEIWKYIISGRDPWGGRAEGFTFNAYGPLFNALAVPASVALLLPKVLFCLTHSLCAIAFLRAAERATRALQGRHLWVPWVVVGYFWSPFFWCEIAWCGNFDILVGTLTLAAVVNACREHGARSGAFLSAGILLKYYPCTLLPFLVTQPRAFRWRIAATAAALTVTGLAASLLIWGSSTFKPLTFGVERPSKFLSVFAFLRGPYSLLRLWIPEPNVDWLSLPLMAVVILTILAISLARRIDLPSASLAAMTATLACYKVGHTQYQMTLFLLAALWYQESRHRDLGRFQFSWPVAAYLSWITAWEILWLVYTDLGAFAGLFSIVSGLAGIITFAMATNMICYLVIFMPTSEASQWSSTGARERRPCESMAHIAGWSFE